MQNRKYELLLAAVIAARATSFVFSKLVVLSMDKYKLLALRFLAPFVLLVIVFHREVARGGRRELAAGAAIGFLYYLVMSCELTALKTTASSTVSLLENCSILFVPLFEALLLKRFPDGTTLLSALTALLGVFCLTAQQGGVSGGVAFGLLAAALYAAAIILTARVSRKTEHTLCVGIIQVGTIGVLALGSSFAFESPHLPAGGGQWLMILVLAVVCTGFGFTLQPVAQSHVSVERAGLFCAINPAIAAVLGTVILHERFGFFSAAGLLLILLSIALPSLLRKKSV